MQLSLWSQIPALNFKEIIFDMIIIDNDWNWYFFRPYRPALITIPPTLKLFCNKLTLLNLFTTFEGYNTVKHNTNAFNSTQKMFSALRLNVL